MLGLRCHPYVTILVKVGASARAERRGAGGLGARHRRHRRDWESLCQGWIYILHKIFSHHYLNKNYVCRRVRGGEVAKLNISFFSILSLLSETVKIRMSSLKLFTSSLYIMFFSSSNYL